MLVNVTAKLRSVTNVGNLVRKLLQTTTEVLDTPIGNLEEEEGFCTLWETIQEDVSLNVLQIKSMGHFPLCDWRRLRHERQETLRCGAILYLSSTCLSVPQGAF